MRPMRTLVSFCSAALLASLFACAPESLGDNGGASDGEPALGGGGKGGTVGTMSAEMCQASPAPAVFGNALCLCGDFRSVGNLVVKGGASVRAPWA